jgi:uncharacterized protein (TIGR03067 family)
VTRRALVPTIVVTLAVLLVLPAGSTAQATKPAPGKPATSKQAAALQGTWIITSINGQAAAPGTPQLTLTFTGDKYHQAVDGVVNERGTIKLDASKKPMTFDLAITEGQDTGKAQLGIIEVIGDKLRASLDQPNAGKRPADFEMRPGEIAVVGQRKKP